MFDKILRRLGLVRLSSLTEEDINAVLLSSIFDRWSREKFPKDAQDEVIDIFRKHPVLKEYFDWSIAQDVKRFYSATPQEQDMIRGAVSRTRYFRTLCVVPREEESKPQKLNLKRYVVNI
jgi:hypothetical protein